MSAEAVLRLLGTSPLGLALTEVTTRQRRYGSNSLPLAPPTRWWVVLLRQFVSPLIGIMVVANLITIVQQHWVDAAAIGVVLVLTVTLGYWQERKAEREVHALRSLSSSVAHVRRDGTIRVIPATEVVPGDIVAVVGGERVPADLRIVEANRLRVDESMLTGESLPVAKAATRVHQGAPVAERHDMAFSGALVASGRGLGVVVATGQDTELGSIEKLMTAPPPPTPLQVMPRTLEWRIGGAILVAVLFLFVAGLVSGFTVADMFQTAVALTVAAIPESMPVILTIALSVGISRMARRNAIVRRLPAVETLGSTTVIASDKTGTLTQNRLTVEQVWTVGGYWEPGMPADPDTVAVLRAGALTNETSRTSGGELHGDPVDVAMSSVALDASAVSATEITVAPERHTPYEPVLGYSQSVRALPDGERALYVKGAPETLLAASTSLRTPHGPRPLKASTVSEANAVLARDGLRVVATASRSLGPDELTGDPLPAPEGLEFLGLEGMTDPPREGVADAIAACAAAGIAVKMVTGDQPTTAEAIASRLGLPSEGPPLTGAEIGTLDDNMLAARLEETSVAARMVPQDKLRIVRALQSRGEVVAVTGDGVNDAPALRAAQIGVAMGRSGTDVAREAAGLVLTDDDFVTIVHAVEQGRVTFAAIRNATFFLLSTAVAAVLALAINVLLDQPLLFLPVQILFINVVTSSIQDIALAFEPARGDELSRPPRSPQEGILSRRLWYRTFITGAWMGLIVPLVFGWALHVGDSVEHARTLALVLFVIFNVFQVGNARAETASLLRLNPFSNPLLFATAFGSVLVVAALLVWPAATLLLGLAPLTLAEWAMMAALALTVLAIVEADKLIWAALDRRQTRARGRRRR
jgi:Ca2+-transporting ATPase